MNLKTDGEKLRQEIDGPQAEQLDFILCGRMLQNSRIQGKLSPAKIRDKRLHIPSSKSQGHLPDYPTTHAQKDSFQVKREGAPPHSK